MKEIIIEVPDRFGQELKPEKVNSEIKGELVRCKDCKYSMMTLDNELVKYCELQTDIDDNLIALYHDPDWYCANAERRDDDG